MKRFLIALLVGGVLFAAVFGAAASLGVNTSTLGAGSGSVSSCDTDGVDVKWYTHMTDNAGPGHPYGGVWVDKVEVINIDSACDGKYAHMSIRANGNHVQMCRQQIASSAALMDRVSRPSGSGDEDCLNDGMVWADEVDGVRVIIKDYADW